MKHVILCADDFAIAPGVSQAIRSLIADRRINATSVMTLFPDLEAEAGALISSVDRKVVSVGLHLTLTGGFAALHGAIGSDGRLPGLADLILRAYTGRLDPEAVQDEVEAQFVAFETAFGTPPDHVDGHQHVHVLPVIRQAVLSATRRHAPKAWLRDVTPSRATLSGIDLKGRVIGALAHGFARDAARAGLATSKGFAGIYDFSADHDFAPLLAHFLSGVPEEAVVMVHPGHVDDPLTARDPVTHQREVEFEVLHGPQMLDILAQAQVRLF